MACTVLSGTPCPGACSVPGLQKAEDDLPNPPESALDETPEQISAKFNGVAQRLSVSRALGAYIAAGGTAMAIFSFYMFAAAQVGGAGSAVVGAVKGCTTAQPALLAIAGAQSCKQGRVGQQAAYVLVWTTENFLQAHTHRHSLSFRTQHSLTPHACFLAQLLIPLIRPAASTLTCGCAGWRPTPCPCTPTGTTSPTSRAACTPQSRT